MRHDDPDFLLALADAEHPVLAHHFLNFLLDPKNALLNFNGIETASLATGAGNDVVDVPPYPDAVRVLSRPESTC